MNSAKKTRKRPSASVDEHFRRLDLQFLALLRSSTLAELMGLERLEENQLAWRQAALSRAIWRAMLRPE